MKRFIGCLLIITLLGSQQVWGTTIPKEVENACNKYGNEYGICPEVLKAIAYRESRYVPNVSNGNCKGLMQVNDKIHAERMKKLGVKDIYSIDGNIHVATDYLAELLEENEDIAYALDRYSGNKSAKANLTNGKVSKYASSVLKMAEEMEREQGK